MNLGASLFDERRAAESAAFLLFKAGGTLPLLKLVKLLYLAERLSLERYGEPLTGDRLVSMDHGPVLSAVYNHMNGMLQSGDGGWDAWIADRASHNLALRDASMIRSPEQDLLRLSDTDLEVLGDTWEKFGHWDKWDLRDYTHELAEWQDPYGSSEPISYSEVFEAIGYSDEQIDELTTRIREQRQLNMALAGKR